MTDAHHDDPTAFLETQLQDLRDQGLYNTIRTIGSPMDGHITVDGKPVLNFCANNYLGLANHPRLKEAAKRAIDQYGIGPGAVRSIHSANAATSAFAAASSIGNVRSHVVAPSDADPASSMNRGP